MNKVLIVIIVIISAYLAYNSMSDTEENTSVTSSTQRLDIKEQIKEAPVPEETYTYDNKSTSLDGRYILNITTETTETSQVFTFSSDGKFELSRQMISPDPSLAGSIEGTYFIKGNTVHLVFPADRDKKTFTVDTAEMTIKSETELEYSGFIAKLD